MSLVQAIGISSDRVSLWLSGWVSADCTGREGEREGMKEERRERERKGLEEGEKRDCREKGRKIK